MKLRNKKTGEIGTLIVDGAYKFVTNFAVEDDEGNRLGKYNSLAELNEEWEDYEEPKWDWYIDWDGEIKQCDNRVDALLKFETKEEAEKAVEKLKAWTRLEDKGFRFKCWEYDDRYAMEMPCILIRAKKIRDCEEYLDLLFGGEK